MKQMAARWLQALVAITLVATLVGCGTTRRAPLSDTPRPYPAARVPCLLYTSDAADDM
jgi:hypothetical protein